MRRTIAPLNVVVVSLVSLGAARASAEPLVERPRDLAAKGHIILGAERVMPLLAYTKESTNTDANDSQSTSVTSVSLFSYGVPSSVAYTIPRFALDYTIADNVTLGGALLVFFDLGNSTSDTVAGVTRTTDNAKSSAFGIAPRAGYLVPLSSNLWLWARGGLSFYSESTSSPTSANSSTGYHQLALDLEPMFAYAPARHIAFLFGPAADIPLSGSVSSTTGGTTTSVDHSQFHIGITAGLFGWFGR